MTVIRGIDTGHVRSCIVLCNSTVLPGNKDAGDRKRNDKCEHEQHDNDVRAADDRRNLLAEHLTQNRLDQIL